MSPTPLQNTKGTSKVLHASAVLRMWYNTAPPKLRAHVIEGILSARAKFHYSWLKKTVMRKITMAVILIAVPKDKSQSVTQFLKLQNVSDREIHARMCVVYGAQNNHKINREPIGT